MIPHSHEEKVQHETMKIALTDW